MVFARLLGGKGPLGARMIPEAGERGGARDSLDRVRWGWEAGGRLVPPATSPRKGQDRDPGPLLIEPLSQRELEVLQLVAQGLSNREIGERLFLALDTVKGHNRRIFDKLQVQRRTEAIVRARELGLL